MPPLTEPRRRGFKEQLARDVRHVFLNVSEFADLHEVNGKTIPAVVDSSRFDALPDVQALHNEPLSLYVAEGKMHDLPRPDDPVTVDGYHYRCFGVSVEQGVYRIDLESVINR